MVDEPTGGVAVYSRTDDFRPQVGGALLVMALFHSVGTQIFFNYVVQQLWLGSFHGLFSVIAD